MTFSTATNDNLATNCSTVRRRRRSAFTLVELLVVIGIMLALMGILLPAIIKTYKLGVQKRMSSDLQAISTALEAYRQDHGDVPRTSPDGLATTGLNNGVAGAQILCRALVGPGDIDGATGFGFRTKASIAGVQQGRVYGPYLPADKFKLVTPTVPPTTAASLTDMNAAMLADSNGQPILYYPGIKSIDPTRANTYVSDSLWPTATRSVFNSSDNSTYEPPRALKLMLGGPTLASTGQLGTGEQPAYVGAFLLVGAGPDATFGPTDLTQAISNANPCDDTTLYAR